MEPRKPFYRMGRCGPLPEGQAEAQRAGAQLREVPVDVLFTSVLKRAMRTADIALAQAGKTGLPTHRDQALNERHYGDLQGLNKAETAEKYGTEQVHIWRRSYDVPPPGGESLKDTRERVAPTSKSISHRFCAPEPMFWWLRTATRCAH